MGVRARLRPPHVLCGSRSSSRLCSSRRPAPSASLISRSASSGVLRVSRSPRKSVAVIFSIRSILGPTSASSDASIRVLTVVPGTEQRFAEPAARRRACSCAVSLRLRRDRRHSEEFDKDYIKGWYNDESQRGGHGQAEDHQPGHALPQRSPGQGQREQTADGR